MMDAYLQSDREYEEAEALADALSDKLASMAWDIAIDMVNEAQKDDCSYTISYTLQCLVVDALEGKTEDEINHYRKVHGLGDIK